MVVVVVEVVVVVCRWFATGRVGKRKVESPVQIAQCSAVCSAAQLGAGSRKVLPTSGSYIIWGVNKPVLGVHATYLSLCSVMLIGRLFGC